MAPKRGRSAPGRAPDPARGLGKRCGEGEPPAEAGSRGPCRTHSRATENRPASRRPQGEGRPSWPGPVRRRLREQHHPSRPQPCDLQDDLQRAVQRPGQVQLLCGNRLGYGGCGREFAVSLAKLAIVGLAIPADLVQLRHDGVEGVPQVAGYRVRCVAIHPSPIPQVMLPALIGAVCIGCLLLYRSAVAAPSGEPLIAVLGFCQVFPLRTTTVRWDRVQAGL